MKKCIFLIVIFSSHSSKYTRIRELRFNHSPKEMLGWFWYLCLVLRLRKRWSLVGGDSQQGNIGDTGFASTCWFLIPLYIFPGWQFFLQTTTKQSDKQSCHLVSAPTPDLAKLIVKSTFACVACGYSAVSVCDLFNLADVCRWLNCSSYLVFSCASWYISAISD